MFETWVDQLQDFIFRNFVPETVAVIQERVVGFAEKASDLPTVGVTFLVATSLLLVSEIERAFNQIWRVRTPRPLGSRILLYWAALTVGPLLLGLSLAITSYLVSLPWLEDATSSLSSNRPVLQILPFAVAVLAFTLGYVMVPNRSVPWRFAFAGGGLAAVLFEAAKRGFAYYVSEVRTYEDIYGAALAAVPLFLIWIYISWVVVLLGATFAAGLQSFRAAVHLEGWKPERELLLAYRLVGHLFRGQRKGEGRTLAQLWDCEPGATEKQLRRLLHGFEETRLAHSGAGGEWFLSRDPGEVTFLDLYRSGAFALPSPEELTDGAFDWHEVLRTALTSVNASLARQLSVPLKELYLEEESGPPVVDEPHPIRQVDS